jgi:uncharacterized OB-fold protein
MKHPAPHSGTTSSAHFRAAAQGRLALPYCSSCAQFHWPIRSVCPHCQAVDIVWRDARGGAMLEAWSVVRRAVNPALKDEAPYIVAFVELDEGVRLFTNIVGAEPASLRHAQRLRCRFEAVLGSPSEVAEQNVPVFMMEE